MFSSANLSSYSFLFLHYSFLIRFYLILVALSINFIRPCCFLYAILALLCLSTSFFFSAINSVIFFSIYFRYSIRAGISVLNFSLLIFICLLISSISELVLFLYSLRIFSSFVISLLLSLFSLILASPL